MITSLPPTVLVSMTAEDTGGGIQLSNFILKYTNHDIIFYYTYISKAVLS